MSHHILNQIELALFNQIEQIRALAKGARENKELQRANEILRKAAAFFDGVMVMADDADLKANRLRLLAQLRNFQKNG